MVCYGMVWYGVVWYGIIDLLNASISFNGAPPMQVFKKHRGSCFPRSSFTKTDTNITLQYGLFVAWYDMMCMFWYVLVYDVLWYDCIAWYDIVRFPNLLLWIWLLVWYGKADGMVCLWYGKVWYATSRSVFLRQLPDFPCLRVRWSWRYSAFNMLHVNFPPKKRTTKDEDTTRVLYHLN